jgi:hypothetical protein
MVCDDIIPAWMSTRGPRFGLDSPLWIGGFLPLVWLIGAIRQLVAWYEGRPASWLLDPVRSRLGRRALPTLAWIAAPFFTGVLLYAALRLGGIVTEGLDVTEGLIRSGGASLALLYGTFFRSSSPRTKQDDSAAARRDPSSESTLQRAPQSITQRLHLGATKIDVAVVFDTHQV